MIVFSLSFHSVIFIVHHVEIFSVPQFHYFLFSFCFSLTWFKYFYYYDHISTTPNEFDYDILYLYIIHLIIFFPPLTSLFFCILVPSSSKYVPYWFYVLYDYIILELWFHIIIYLNINIIEYQISFNPCQFFGWAHSFYSNYSHNVSLV